MRLYKTLLTIKTLAFFSSFLFFTFCTSKKEVAPVIQVSKLDSTVTSNNVAYKYVYEGNKIKEAKRYFLNNPSYPEKLIGKVEYKYSGEKIIEKNRYFIFPTGYELTQTLFFTYNQEGKIEGIKMTKPTLPGFELNFTYLNGNLVHAKFNNDTINFFYDNDGNIKEAMYQSSFYTYISEKEPNPFLKENFFLNDYELSNPELFLYLLDIPVYFNKNRIQILKQTGNPNPYRTFLVTLNSEGLITKFRKNDYDWLTGNINGFREVEYFYKK